jgi:DNA-binding NarL/FixJ family response regulator
MVILVLEDEMLLAMDMEDALAKAGHEVMGPCTSVQSALAAAEHRKPDLVLTNINLGEGGGNGIDAAREFLRRYDVPALFVSGSKEEAFQGRDAALGILSKPCRPEQIASSVEAVKAVMDGVKPDFVPPGLELFSGNDD